MKRQTACRAIIGAVMLFSPSLLYGGPPVLQEENAQAPLQAMKESAALEEKWGIQILSIHISAGGYMLDFRYKVLDPQKAAPLFDRKNKPVLVHEKTGAKFAVPAPPKIGSLRQTRPPVAGKHYFMIFANPGKYVKPGDKVTVTAGDFRAEGLTVE